MMSYPLVLGASILGVLAFSVIVYSITGAVVSILVVFTLAGILGYVLYQFGYFKVDSKTGGISIDFFEKEPAPRQEVQVIDTAANYTNKEVYYVSGNDYTYNDAAAVCAAYGADLASYDQLMQAYSEGADWCGYGWTQGGMALYPTQESTWKTLQGEIDNTKRTACGRPGVNGGYFDPNTKFGVNCFGVKPADKGERPPLPGQDKNAINKFKSMLGKMSISPYNRSEWSKWNILPSK